MAQFYALAMGNAGDYKREILSCTVLEHLSLAVEAAGGQLYLASDNTEAGEITTADFWKKAGDGPVLLFLAPAAGIGADTVVIEIVLAVEGEGLCAIGVASDGDSTC